MSDMGNEVFKAIGWKKLPFGGNDLFISLDANACHAVARLIAPLIAEAQAVALEDAAKMFHHASVTAYSLHSRAAKLRGES